GQWENNELHVPVGQPVTLNLTSIDVIHDFFVPAFRTKQDAVPGRYTTLSFTATKAGTYNLFCAEYCGTGHSRMIGSVTAMEPAEYETWLAGANNAVSPAARGLEHFESYGCDTCHRDDNAGVGPSLAGVYGREEQLADGKTVLVDDSYIRESILNPQKNIVQRYGPPSKMPTFAGRLSETELIDLIAYIRSLGSAQQGQPGGSTTPPDAAETPGAGSTESNSSTDSGPYQYP
ncbi:MAG: c-type cytochrome, partial [Chloroflexota bacterium]|nr:c-type cytochrome [Chloroflexota bacterium]